MKHDLIKVRLSRGIGLCRDGATGHCIYCGLPDWLTFAHIHKEDLHLSDGDPKRVFRLCWSHHHGAYRQYRISTKELFECERVWIEEPAHRPEPHPRDVELLQRPQLGDEWTGGKYAICKYALPNLLQRMETKTAH
jgi:hypothetical protein